MFVSKEEKKSTMYLIKLLANLLKILRGTRKTITYFTYQITRTEQKWPSNWLESLHVDQFKKLWLNSSEPFGKVTSFYLSLVQKRPL